MSEIKELILEDGAYPTEIPSKKSSAVPRKADDGCLRAPIPGVVAAVVKKEGDEAAAGDTIVRLEAMKMENELSCPFPGRVEKVTAKVGDRVKKNDILVKLSPLKKS